jgi:hypothetical protein
VTDLAATNWILIVIAAASVVQVLVVIAFALGALRAYRETTKLVDAKLTPALLRLEGVLINLERTSAVVRTRTDDVNRALDSARHTATRVGAVMGPRAAMVAGVAGGVLGLVKRWRAARRTQPKGTVVAG